MKQRIALTQMILPCKQVTPHCNPATDHGELSNDADSINEGKKNNDDIESTRADTLNEQKDQEVSEYTVDRRLRAKVCKKAANKHVVNFSASRFQGIFTMLASSILFDPDLASRCSGVATRVHGSSVENAI